MYCKKITELNIADVCKLYLNEEDISYSKSMLEEYIENAKVVYNKMLKAGSYTYGCFIDDNTLAGVINVNKILDYYPKYDKVPYVHLETFIVDKKYQNQGVGTFLMQSALEVIKQEGVSYIIIQSANPYVHKICKKVGLTDSRKDARIDFVKQM